MKKKPLKKEMLKKTIKTTQAIEGYIIADSLTREKISKIKKQYDIKVSVHK